MKWRGDERGALWRKLRRAGWRVEKTNGGHVRITAPSGAFVFAAGTQSDWRGYHRMMSDLRKIGWKDEE